MYQLKRKDLSSPYCKTEAMRKIMTELLVSPPGTKAFMEAEDLASREGLRSAFNKLLVQDDRVRSPMFRARIKFKKSNKYDEHHGVWLERIRAMDHRAWKVDPITEKMTQVPDPVMVMLCAKHLERMRTFVLAKGVDPANPKELYWGERDPEWDGPTEEEIEVFMKEQERWFWEE